MREGFYYAKDPIGKNKIALVVKMAISLGQTGGTALAAFEFGSSAGHEKDFYSNYCPMTQREVQEEFTRRKVGLRNLDLLSEKNNSLNKKKLKEEISSLEREMEKYGVPIPEETIKPLPRFEESPFADLL